MKIKQHGQIPNWELEVTCKRCGAVIILEKPEDMYVKAHPTGKTDGIYVDYSNRTYHFTCPECKQENTIDPERIREDIIEKIRIKN